MKHTQKVKRQIYKALAQKANDIDQDIREALIYTPSIDTSDGEFDVNVYTENSVIEDDGSYTVSLTLYGSLSGDPKKKPNGNGLLKSVEKSLGIALTSKGFIYKNIAIKEIKREEKGILTTPFYGDNPVFLNVKQMEKQGKEKWQDNYQGWQDQYPDYNEFIDLYLQQNLWALDYWWDFEYKATISGITETG